MVTTKGKPQQLPEEALDYLRVDGEELSFGDGEKIVRRGDPGDAFYVILAGMVEVRLTAETDSQLPLAHLEERTFFGEMSLITEDPVSADVVALGPVKILKYPGRLFSKALSESSSLRSQILSGMAANLQRTTDDAWNFFQRAEALNVLMSTGSRSGELVAISPTMARIGKKVEAASAEEGPLLIRGESGTGKTFVASKVHEKSARKHRSFIVVDCRALAKEEAVRFVFGSCRFGEASGDREGFGTLQHYGALHLAHEGTLVLRHVEDLPRGAQEMLSHYIDSVREGRTDYPRTRLIATASGGAKETIESHALDPGLEAHLAPGTISLPPLKSRRKDIVPLAKLFLEEYRRSPEQHFTLPAEHTLLSRQYSHNNVAELKEAVQMGALFADGVQIEPEHIFTGPKDEGGGYEYDLQGIPLIRRLTSLSTLKISRSIAFIIFAAVIAFSLFSGGRVSATANAVTWALWEPALVFLFLFAGRVWCGICPLSTAGRIACRIRNFQRQPDEWLKKYSGWFVMAGFIAVILSEHLFHMTENPFSAGILLLSLMGAAVFFSVVYQRETWCRYLCPLGNLGAVYALPAMVTVRANPNVCSTYCTTHECFKGSKELPGCPVFHHPLYARGSHHCKQCCTCLWSCPHDSAKLYLRLPLQSVWRQGDVGTGLVPFALFLFFFSPFMLASQASHWPATHGGFTFNALLAVVCTLVFRPYLPRIFSAGEHADPALPARVAFSLLVLAWGPGMAYQLGHIESLSRMMISGEEGSALALVLGGGELTVRAALQGGAILLGGLLASICFFGIRMRLASEGEKGSRWGWRLFFVVCVLYILASLVLLLPGGVTFR